MPTVTSGRKTFKDTANTADIYNIGADATRVTISGKMTAGDIINLEGLASEYTASAVGRTITLKSATQTVTFQLSNTAGTASIRFLDGDLTAAFATKGGATLGGVKLTKKAVDIDDSKLGALDASAVDFTGSGSTGGGSTGGGSANVGSSFTLTTSIDVVSGTSGNDTIIGDAATIVTSDQVSGGAGNDTIKIFDLAAATDVPTLSSVETIELVNAAAPGNALDLSGVTDLATLVLDNATNTDNYTIGATVTASLKGMADGESITLTSTAADKSMDVVVTNMGTIAGAGVTVNADGASVTTINLASSGTVAATTDSDITLASTGTETTVNVTGTGDLALTTAASVVTLNASAFTGNLTYTSGATTTATSITTGSGNDTVTATAAVNYTINLGDGNDVLTTADAAGELSTADSISGGAGTDVLAISAAEAETLDDGVAADTAVLAKITGFERLRITDAADGGGTAAFDIGNLGYNYLQVTTALGADATVTGFATGGTIEFRGAASSANDYIIGMTGATAGGSNSDTFNVVLNADLSTNDTSYTHSLDLQGINIVNVVANDRDTSTVADTDADGNEGYVIDLAGGTAANSSNIKTVNISGGAQVSYTIAAATTGLESINGSTSTGNVIVVGTAFAGTQGLTISSGTGADQITGSTLGDIITAGGGSDTIAGGTGADVMTGGAGADTFQITRGANATGGAPSATVFDTITDFAKGSDIIDETGGNLVLSTDASTIASSGVAAINAEGVATFHSDDDTLAERIAAVNAGLAAGTEADNQIAIFEFSGSTYVYIYDDAGDTVSSADGLIKLTGVTGITDSTISGGNLTLA
jgi:RTX calcium-binding nonapeptide repeat (4 copies)